MIITINHIRAYGYCAKGAREFFNAHHLSWHDFLTNGIEAETLLATGDTLAIDLINNIKNKEVDHG